MKRIAVYCGSKKGNNPLFVEAAIRLGKALAARQITLIYGGGKIGLMGTIADAALENGGEVIGVIPDKLFEMEVAHTALTKLHRVRTMHERKALMEKLSDGFIAMPGGIGTMEEITEMMTWAQIGYHQKPCGFLNVAGYYDPFLTFLQKAEQEGFLYDRVEKSLCINAHPEALLKNMQSKTR